MKLKILSFAAMVMLFATCSSDEPNLPPEAEKIPQVANPYRVSLDDALGNAETLLSQISEAETRSGRRVASVKYLTMPSTRSADSDTMLYLVNYENDGGFALLSADSRLHPVYAISDEGSLNLEDTVYNKGLAMFARGVEAEIASLPVTPILPGDSIFPGPLPPTPIFRDTIVIKSKVGPLLNSHVRNWGQDAPYNRYCFMADGGQAIVGCAAVAAGQIMAYHEWPLDYDGYYYEWDAMKNGQDDDLVAHFLRSLGNPENLNMRYGNYGEANGNGSSAFTSRYYPTFTHMGYMCENLTSFSEENIRHMLSGTYNPIYPATPVLIDGRDDPEGNSPGGHAWVIDGWLQNTYRYILGSFINDVVDDYLYHCVWGWGGKSNGYFYFVDDKRFYHNIIEKDEYDTNPDVFDFNYYFNCKYIGGLVPVKAVPAD